MMRVLILGGVAAGTKVAAKLKRLRFDTEVLILTKDADISYAGCGLPYYVGDVITDREKIIVNTPEKFAALTGAKVLTGREAVKLDAAGKTVTAKNLATGEEEVYPYDACVISTGASSIVPPLQGVNLKGVFTMRTPDDAEGLKNYVKASGAKTAVVAGGGFIGLEVAENLLEQGLDVTVMDMAPQVMPGFDPEFAAYGTRHLEKVGIHVSTSTKMEGITGSEKAEGVQTDKGLIPADVVVLSLGIRPNTAFLKETGLEFAKNGAILVDKSLRTNLPDVYAAGDCAVVSNRLTGERAWAPMGSAANMEGRVLAEVLAGREKEFAGVLGTAVVKLPGLNAARTGLNEAAARAAGYDVETVVAVNDD
ncbi:FAD/NAD(P)-binding oxidoreductase, partial [Anaerotignum lactatifermentans]